MKGKGKGSFGGYGKGGGKDIRSLQNMAGSVHSGREIFIKYLPHDAKEAELKEYFSEAGEIEGNVKLMRDAMTGRVIRGFIVFKTAAAFEEALSWDGCRYGNRSLKIEKATTTGTLQADGTHTPALWKEVLRDLVQPDPDGVYVDGTFGRGGHTRVMLGKLSDKGRLHGFDMDPEAIVVGKQLEAEDSRFTIHHAPFGEMQRCLTEAGVPLEGVSGVLLDLGISSPQLDGNRGFRPEVDAPLDMRYDVSEGKPTAWDLLQTISREELARVIHEYGGENALTARRIADAVVLAREAQAAAKKEAKTGGGSATSIWHAGIPNRTVAFAGLVNGAKGREYQLMHPAKLTFQALRIMVNKEFNQFREGMLASLEIMRAGGRLGVLTWKHSECAILVDVFKRHECATLDFPLLKWFHDQRAQGKAAAKEDGKQKKGKDKALAFPKLPLEWGFLMQQPRRPTAEELKVNSRSHSAVLHVLRKERGVRVDMLEKMVYPLLGWNSAKLQGEEKADQETTVCLKGTNKRQRTSSEEEVGSKKSKKSKEQSKKQSKKNKKLQAGDEKTKTSKQKQKKQLKQAKKMKKKAKKKAQQKDEEEEPPEV